ncbi:MAG: hypothetical protein EXR20_09710 [Bacteroidetes bacterium]|jgi:N-methylhydantoinase B/oxoprolinase/acetone carboxylase alpha subunit|nr:hypothetical protein [Bacteroidota bacterium]
MSKLFQIIDRIPSAEILNDGFKNSIVDELNEYIQAPKTNINDTYALLTFLKKVCEDSLELTKPMLLEYLKNTSYNQTKYNQYITLQETKVWDYGANKMAERAMEDKKTSDAKLAAIKSVIKKNCEMQLNSGEKTEVPLIATTIAVYVKPITTNN